MAGHHKHPPVWRRRYDAISDLQASNNVSRGYVLLMGTRRSRSSFVTACREMARLTPRSCPTCSISGTTPLVLSVIRRCGSVGIDLCTSIAGHGVSTCVPLFRDALPRSGHSHLGDGQSVTVLDDLRGPAPRQCTNLCQRSEVSPGRALASLRVVAGSRVRTSMARRTWR